MIYLYDDSNSVGVIRYHNTDCYVFFRVSHDGALGDHPELETYYLVSIYGEYPMNARQMSLNAVLRIRMDEVHLVSQVYPKICDFILSDYTIRTVHES